jgi:hypothetical protein
VSDRYFAGSRTARLINQAFFDGAADERKITDGLYATRVRLVADQANATSRAAQASIATTFQLVARMGMVVELDLPDVALVDVVPPLCDSRLLPALLELGTDLLPEAIATTELKDADVSFVYGSTPSTPEAIRVHADDFTCSLTTDEHGNTLDADSPLGGMAAAAAAAALALEAGLPRIEATAGRALSARPRPSPGPPVNVDLRELFPGLVARAPQLDRLDIVSGGAITNAFLQTLLWLPDAHGRTRVIERERGDHTNLNRYNQLRASHDGELKIDVLATASRSGLIIIGVETLFLDETREALRPLAPVVAVGVDNVCARWWVQEEWPDLLVIGATDNTSAVLTTHRPGEPCAGCAHPDPLPPLAEGEFIPTISVISFWGGFMQALALMSAESPSRRVTVYPFALGGGHWWHAADLPEGARCAINCPASNRQAA